MEALEASYDVGYVLICAEFGKGIIPAPVNVSPMFNESSFPGICNIYISPALVTIADVGINLSPQRINLQEVHLASAALFIP